MREKIELVGVAILLLFAVHYASAQTQSPEANPPSASQTNERVFRVGGGVSAPRVIHQLDPEYSDEARKEKIEGVCVLYVVVGPDGLPRDIRVQRVLGHGLDEKAIEAVRQWKFEPALKDGKPVAAAVNVEVTFHLYRDNRRISDLEQRANVGDAKAELDLSKAYFEGRDVARDERMGYQFLRRAADRGLPEAQFQMGEYTASHGSQPGDYIAAYMWFALAQRNHYKDSDKKLKELALKMSSEDIAEGQKRAEDWRPHK